MKKSFKPLLVFTILLVLSGCTARSCQSLEKEFQYSERNYHVRVFSGDSCIATYQFYGILNDSENSDGYYFFQGDTLIEVSGNVEIKSWKK